MLPNIPSEIVSVKLDKRLGVTIAMTEPSAAIKIEMTILIR